MTAHDLVTDLGRAYREGRLDLLRPDHRHRDPGPAAAPFTTINIRGKSYRLKERRKAGLFPRAEEEARPAPFPSSSI